MAEKSPYRASNRLDFFLESKDLVGGGYLILKGWREDDQRFFQLILDGVDSVSTVTRPVGLEGIFQLESIFKSVDLGSTTVQVLRDRLSNL